MAPQHHLYVASDPRDHAFVGELVAALRGEGWSVFDAHADIAAGDDAGKVRAEAWSNSAWFLLLRSRAGDDTLRAEALRALEKRRTDPMGTRVLPVHLDKLDPLDHKFSDLGLLQAIDATDGDAGKVANIIQKVADAKGLRHWGQHKARVAILAVRTELGEASGRVREMVEGLRSQVAEAIEVDLADDNALEQVEGSLLRVMLLGGSTAGNEGAQRVQMLLQDPGRVVVGYLEPMPREVRKRFKKEEVDGRNEIVDLAEEVCTMVPFETPGDAPTRLRDPVAERLEALLPKAPVEGGRAVLEAWERWYLDSQGPIWEDGRAGGLRGWSKECKLERSLLYVSLHAGPGRWRRDKEGIVRVLPAGDTGTPQLLLFDEPAAIFLDELLSHKTLPRVVVVGEAGSGKTVLLQHLAWSLASHLRGRPLPEACRLDIGALSAGKDLVPVPILIEARHLADAARKGGAGTIERVLNEALGGRAPDGAVQRGLDTGRYLLLVDSLDEVPGTTAREKALGVLKGLASSSPCRVVLTTRPTAHTAVTVPRSYERVDIAPLSQDRRQALVSRWRMVENLTADTARRLPEALAGLEANFPQDGGGRSPLENPLLLTCVLLVFIEQERLPDNLADLYERMVRHLCDRRPEDPDARQEAQKQSAAWRRELLVQVSHVLQEKGTTALPAEELCDQLVGERFKTRYDAREALDQLAVTTGLFRFEDEARRQVVRPWHRSFQEYLAACALAGRDQSAEAIVRQLWKEGILADPGWEGCLRFAVGSFGMMGTERAQGFVRALMALAERERGHLREGRLLGLAAMGVVEYGREHFSGAEPAGTLRRLVAERFGAFGAQWPWKDRLLALSALGRLPGGDPRLPDPRESTEGWVLFPAGTYTIGGDTEASRSLPSQEVRVERFFLRAWPVTVSEYRAFLMDTSAETPWEWSEQVHRPNAPVTGMFWNQARAFCRWATGKWKRPEPEGTFDLPDSYEWEVAARYRHDGLFPWGSEPPGEDDLGRANYRWNVVGPNKPTPVGMFPTGNAGALLDMAGNVMEWCASLSGDTQDTPVHEENPLSVEDCMALREADNPVKLRRVLRGGSYHDDVMGLRSASRNNGELLTQYKAGGLRLIFRKNT